MITSGPPQSTTDTTATIGFTDTQPGVSFECLYPGYTIFLSCGSPATASYLGLGTYTFRVRALDTAGTASAETTYTWTVIAPPPPPPPPPLPQLTLSKAKSDLWRALRENIGPMVTRKGYVAMLPIVANELPAAHRAGGGHLLVLRQRPGVARTD